MVSPRAGTLNQRVGRLYGRPKWCHTKASTMMMVVGESTNDRLVFGNKRAKLTIVRAASVRPGMDGWIVTWEIDHGGCNISSGCRHFTREDMVRAFFHSPDADSVPMRDVDLAIIRAFHGDFARAGKFIIWRGHLNIPGPGTGHNGDPNISICLNNEILNAVDKLLLSAK